MARTFLGDRDAERSRRRKIDHARIDQPIMHDDIGGFERFDGAHGQQARIARTRAYEDDAALRVGIEKTSHEGEMGFPAPDLK